MPVMVSSACSNGGGKGAGDRTSPTCAKAGGCPATPLTKTGGCPVTPPVRRCCGLAEGIALLDVSGEPGRKYHLVASK